MDEPARVTHGAHVTLHYRIAVLADGAEREVISTFGAGPATLTVGAGELAPPLEQRLLGLAEGDRADFELEAGEGFGPHSAQLVRRVSRAEFDARRLRGDGAPGDLVQLASPEGAPLAGLVRAGSDEHLTIDFNHPLAGAPIRMSVHVLGVLT